jgi:2Fe-2S ferredoxin
MCSSNLQQKRNLMSKITFITADGNETILENARGTLMEAALDCGIAGIGGDCGGVGSCGTCHVHIAPEWMECVGSASEFERDVIDLQQNASHCSRLGCQIELTKKLDGLVVRVPNPA